MFTQGLRLQWATSSQVKAQEVSELARLADALTYWLSLITCSFLSDDLFFDVRTLSLSLSLSQYWFFSVGSFVRRSR